jgi:hypothetical protein
VAGRDWNDFRFYVDLGPALAASLLESALSKQLHHFLTALLAGEVVRMDHALTDVPQHFRRACFAQMSPHLGCFETNVHVSVEAASIGSQDHDLAPPVPRKVVVDAELVRIAGPPRLVLTFVAWRAEQPGAQKRESRRRHGYRCRSQDSRVSNYRAGKFLRGLGRIAAAINMEAGSIIGAPVAAIVLFCEFQVSCSNLLCGNNVGWSGGSTGRLLLCQEGRQSKRFTCDGVRKSQVEPVVISRRRKANPSRNHPASGVDRVHHHIESGRHLCRRAQLVAKQLTLLGSGADNDAPSGLLKRGIGDDRRLRLDETRIIYELNYYLGSG